MSQYQYYDNVADVVYNIFVVLSVLRLFLRTFLFKTIFTHNYKELLFVYKEKKM